MARLGLIAGNGRFPIAFAQAARERNYKVVATLIHEETDPQLEQIADKSYWVHIGQLEKIINTFKEEKITEVVMAGKITKTLMYEDIELDKAWKKILKDTKDRNDDTILNSVVELLAENGITVIKSITFLSDLLPSKGVLTQCVPIDKEWKDIEYARGIAKKIAGMDIGQTVVVKNRAVLAVEAIEGTDETIKRAGKLGNGEIIVAKVSKPNQDLRFDMPVIGITTIEVLIEANVRALVLDAEKTIILDMKKVIEKADAHRIAIVALD